MTGEQLAALLTPEKFGEWLKSKPAHHIVGIPGYCADCPIAQYVWEASSYEVKVSVGSNVETQPGYPPYRACYTPKWAQRFIAIVDGDETLDSGVSASKALSVLDRIMETMRIWAEDDGNI